MPRLAALLFVLMVLTVRTATADTTVLNAETIKAGLRTATVEEQGFIDRVVELAKDGTLPPELVESTFQWARHKPAYRFQYFKRGITVRAAKLGIGL